VRVRVGWGFELREVIVWLGFGMVITVVGSGG